MKILLIHQYFKTPDEGGGIRSYYIAQYLAAKGHEVHVITAYNEPLPATRKIEGVQVHYLPVYYTNHLSFWSRLHAFYRFVRMTKQLLRELQPIDLNYVITTPLSTGIIALYAKKKFKTPYIFEVGDLWPDAPIQLGVLKNKLLQRIAYRLERKSYKNAEKIVALSPDIRDWIQARFKRKYIGVITNMADTDLFIFENKYTSLIKKYKVDKKFVITYAGTVGIANHLEYLVGLAEACKKNTDIHFIIIGSGARWDLIKAYSKSKNLSNIDFMDFVGKEGVREIMNISDAVYVSFKKLPILATGSPNKFFDGLAAGKLIIINFEGWIKELIEKAECGFYYDPEKPESFYSLLYPYLANHNKLQESKANAHELALTTFNKNNLLRKLEHFLSIEC